MVQGESAMVKGESFMAERERFMVPEGRALWWKRETSMVRGRALWSVIHRNFRRDVSMETRKMSGS